MTESISSNNYVGSSAKQEFTYKEMPMAVASRSGHTTSHLRNSVTVIGGRNDKLIEIHKLAHLSPGNPATAESSCIRRLCSTLPDMPILPCGRKNHSASIIGDTIVVFGGETFDGRSREPVSELYIIDTKASYTWKAVGRCNIGRAGHVCANYENTIMIHGGIGERNIVSNLTCILKLQNI